MKKILLSTTAIVAATAVTAGVAQAGESNMDIYGYNTFAIGVGDLDNAASTGDRLDVYENGEILFTASTTTDAGMTVKWRVDYETESSNGNFVDENFFTVSDDWGSVIIGSTNMPNYKMHYSGGLYVGNFGLSSNGFTQWTGTPAISDFSGGWMNDNGIFGASDIDHMAYYSPRVGGIQVGIGYAPDANVNDGNGENSVREDTVSAGINYVATHGDMDVALSAGYISHEGGSSGANDNRANDLKLWQAGAQLTTGGLTFGVSYADATDDSNAQVAPGGDSWTAVVGVNYATGPYTVGISFMTSEAEETTANTNDTEGQKLLLGFDYALGGGVDVDAHLLMVDIDGEDVGNGDDQDGWVFVTGMNVGF